jgi:hypothetical protein
MRGSVKLQFVLKQYGVKVQMLRETDQRLPVVTRIHKRQGIRTVVETVGFLYSPCFQEIRIWEGICKEN